MVSRSPDGYESSKIHLITDHGTYLNFLTVHEWLKVNDHLIELHFLTGVCFQLNAEKYFWKKTKKTTTHGCHFPLGETLTQLDKKIQQLPGTSSLAEDLCASSSPGAEIHLEHYRCEPVGAYVTKKGLLMLYTGDGRGKTTAALGQVFRALGQDLRVCFVQFIKGSWRYGELVAAERYKDRLEIHVLGKGFTWTSEDLQKDIEAARQGWKFAKEMIRSGRFQMVVLDEITYLMTYKMVDEQEVVNFLLTRPKNLHIIATGRDAPQSLVDIADMVTEMKAIKHHYGSGIVAQRGIEY